MAVGIRKKNGSFPSATTESVSSLNMPSASSPFSSACSLSWSCHRN